MATTFLPLADGTCCQVMLYDENLSKREAIELARDVASRFGLWTIAQAGSVFLEVPDRDDAPTFEAFSEAWREGERRRGNPCDPEPQIDPEYQEAYAWEQAKKQEYEMAPEAYVAWQRR